MTRLLRHLLAVLSIALFVASGWMWFRSYRWYDQIGRREQGLSGDVLTYRVIEASSAEGAVIVRVEAGRAPSPLWRHVSAAEREAVLPSGVRVRHGIPRFAPEWSLPAGSLANRLGFAAVRHANDAPDDKPALRTLTGLRGPPGPFIRRTREVRLTVVPYWFVVTLAAVWPARLAWLGSSRLLRVRRAARPRRRGYCPACDYDLRASEGRCPECGAISGHRSGNDDL